MRTAIALAAGALVALGAEEAPAQTLTYGSWVPASDWINSVALPEFFRRVEEASGVKWNLIPGGQLAGGVETFAAIQDGVMDAGVAVATYVPNLLPSLAALYTTVVPGNDPVAAAGAANEVMMLHCPSCIAEAAAINQVPFAGYAGAPFVLMCREPVETAEQLKGLRVRASGASYAMLEMAGASVVQVPLTETVSLLQRGGIDCAAGVADWLKTFGYGDFAKYVTDFSFGVSAPVVAFMINRDVWQGLPDEAKEAHLRHFGYLVAEHTINNFIVRNSETLEEQIASNGVQLIEAAPDFADLLARYQAEETAINAGKARELGVEDPEAFIEAYQQAIEKWRGISAEVGTDVEAFAERLWEQVYSKVDANAL